MKKIARILPAFVLIAAAALCLSFDNNGKLSFQVNNEERTELFRTTDDGSGDKYKVVADECTHGESVIECQTGGNVDCTKRTCPKC